MKKIFKNWNIFEISLLIISIILILSSGIFLEGNILAVIMSILSITTAILQAKGKVLSQFIGFVVAIFYSILSFNNKYYGEVIIYITIMIPLYILGIISWLKNKNEETQTVNKSDIHKKECCIIILVNIILFILLYQLLKYLNTDQLLISSISMNTIITATYLIARRNKFSFLFFILNDIILILLWGIPVIQGDLTLIPMLLNPSLLFINDIYGFKNWSK